MKTEIIELIKSYEKIIIHRHVRPDPDAYGSQAGLAEMIKTSFPNKTVLLAGEEEPSLNYLTRLDEISDDQFKEALVIVCDTANEERICDQRYKTGDKVVKIDHHPNREPYGDIMWVDTDSSSTSEMIFELFTEGKNEGFQLNDESARLLYAGIVGDTGRFLFPSTTGKTFEAASDLSKYNFDRTELYENMYQVPLKIAKFKGQLLTDLEPRKSGVAVFKIDKQMLEEYDISSEETHSFVGIAGDIEDILAWVFFVEEDDVIRVRLRSKGPIINGVAADYNGGGHPMASGAKVQSWEEAEKLVEDLDKVCHEYNN
ncbi:bifunctional oligoribonuclease/PAP phosphatase NrnA [Filobacillus milosensis]|uniref:Bifunctional oligoribonuclease/PAP phosphatase NrnA n=1 Tax=Filobacillus milosensis TaxID=94137 RepID=A0A4Y8IVP9_9BACI|nr:bifunctional oligoribonuclease/PAP phosphatase NrnA [Filobacillus milosensis]TFB25037.1 bifunctional oligoribonuclease/PAP phosphatase NrnA [Filobacillus milosensis]